MEQFRQIAEIQSVLFVYLAAGLLCRKLRIISDEMRARLTDFVLFVTLPCMIFHSFSVEFSLEILQRSALALTIAAAIALVSLAVGAVYRGMPEEKRAVMRFGTLVNNAVFGGIPIVSELYGSEAIFLSSFFVIPQRILMWTVGVGMFTVGDKRKGGVWKVLRMPTVIAVYLGLVRMILQLPLPAFLDTALHGLGACTSPLAMVLVGAILADTSLRELFDPAVFVLTAIRQLLLPGILLMALKWLHTETVMTGVSVILTAMPVGSTTAILAKKYGADDRFASRSVFLSTLLSLLTVPLIAAFL